MKIELTDKIYVVAVIGGKKVLMITSKDPTDPEDNYTTTYVDSSQWAEGTSAYINICDNRATYAYN